MRNTCCGFQSLTTLPPALDFVALVVAAGSAEDGAHVSPAGHGEAIAQSPKKEKQRQLQNDTICRIANPTHQSLPD
jgi:hypothetical protein